MAQIQDSFNQSENKNVSQSAGHCIDSSCEWGYIAEENLKHTF